MSIRTAFSSVARLCARVFLPAHFVLAPIAAVAQAPLSSPPAPVPGQRPPGPAGTIAPPGFSIQIQPGPSSASEAARAAGAQMEPAASAMFDPPSTRVGRPVEYSVRIFATDRVPELPVPRPPDGLQLEQAGRGITPSSLGGQILNTIRYSAKPLHAGEFTIPAFQVLIGGRRVMVPAATLMVTEGEPGDIAYQPVRAAIDVPKRDFYIGESIEGRVLFFETPDEQPQFIQHVVKSSGPVLFKPNTRSRSENVVWEGKPTRALIMPVQITPLVPGEAEVNCQVIVHISRSNFGGRGLLSQSTIDVPSARIRVLPLPQIRPAGFTGAVGQFTLAQPRLSAAETEVGEPLVMTVALTGEGNLDGVPAPELEASADWTAYRPTSELQREEESGAGTKIFTYTLIPKREGRLGTPAIPFAFFDPVKRAFVDLTIPPQPLVVKASSNSAQTKAAENAGTPADQLVSSEPPRTVQPTLTGLAEQAGRWHSAPGPNLAQFLWLQTIPPLVLLGLWGWRRRTEYLARNPQIQRRRRARAAARKALGDARAAARRGDAAGFMEASLGALREAASPYDTADAGSLTREEVLRQLRFDDRAARAAETIFERADAARYASHAAVLAESTKLLPELEHAVARLSSRL
jgi:hypothetical protein